MEANLRPWPSTRSLYLIRDAIVSYANNPTLDNTPILNNPVPDGRRGPRPVWIVGFRTIPLNVEDFSDNYPGAERVAELLNNLNSLRDTIPNFNIGLALAPCEDKLWVYPPCPGKNGGPMLITEYTPGMTLFDYIQSRVAFKQVLSLFIQTVQALDFANQKLGFVHGSLTSRQVIVRPIGSSVLIKYPQMTIETSEYPVLVDFEQSILDPVLKGDSRLDLYTLLVTTFIYFPQQFALLSQWYGVGYNPSPQYPDTWWFQNMPDRMIRRSVTDLIGFAMEKFGFQMATGTTQLVMGPADIRGYEPPLIQPGALAGLGSAIKAIRGGKYSKK